MNNSQKSSISRRDLVQLSGIAAAILAARSASAGPAFAFGKTKLGLVTYNVAKDWDLDTLLKNLKTTGIQGVEFRTTHAHGVEPILDAGRRAEVRSKCRDAGLQQWSLGSICEFQSSDAAVVRKNIETCADFVKLARDIGARGVKVRPNGFPKDVPESKTLDQIASAIAECGKIGADNGVEIWMEVHGGGTQLPSNALAIMQRCAHPNVGLTWNSNGTDVKNGTVKEAFEQLGKYIRCCHINDLWGDYPYREFFGLLNASGYDRFTLCEVGSSVKAEDGIVFLNCYKGLWKELQR